MPRFMVGDRVEFLDSTQTRRRGVITGYDKSHDYPYMIRVGEMNWRAEEHKLTRVREESWDRETI